MASSSSDPSRKRGREEDDEESPRRKEVKEQAKEEQAKKDAADQLFTDNRWSVGILLEAFMKLRDVVIAFNMPRPDEPKERTIEALALKIHGLAEDLEKLPMVRDAGGGGSSDGDDNDDDGSSDDGGTPTAPLTTTAPLSLLN